MFKCMIYLVLQCSYRVNISWSGPDLSLPAYASVSLRILVQAFFHLALAFLRVRSVSQDAPRSEVPCAGWSRIAWIGSFESSCHSLTAAASLALIRLSKSRLAKSSTCGVLMQMVYKYETRLNPDVGQNDNWLTAPYVALTSFIVISLNSNYE